MLPYTGKIIGENSIKHDEAVGLEEILKEFGGQLKPKGAVGYELKENILNLLTKVHKIAYNQGLKQINDVSSWRNWGVKMGFYAHFKDEIKKEVFGCMPKKETKLSPYTYAEIGFNKALSEWEKEINKI